LCGFRESLLVLQNRGLKEIVYTFKGKDTDLIFFK
jgi:hypothetical protein